METKQLTDLKPNPLNPRQMTKDQADALKDSLAEFGDLSAIVYNEQLDRLVGGHMRLKTFERMGGNAAVTITQRFDKPNAQGTVAVGYLVHNGEFYPYRAVQWDEAKDLAANVAANNIGGSFVDEALADVNEQIKVLGGEDLLALTGQSNEELERLAQLGSAPEEPEKQSQPGQSMSLHFTDEQAELVNEALGHVLSQHQMDNTENTDTKANAIHFVMRDYLDRLHGLKD